MATPQSRSGLGNLRYILSDALEAAPAIGFAFRNSREAEGRDNIYATAGARIQGAFTAMTTTVGNFFSGLQKGAANTVADVTEVAVGGIAPEVARNLGDARQNDPTRSSDNKISDAVSNVTWAGLDAAEAVINTSVKAIDSTRAGLTQARDAAGDLARNVATGTQKGLEQARDAMGHTVQHLATSTRQGAHDLLHATGENIGRAAVATETLIEGAMEGMYQGAKNTAQFVGNTATALQTGVQGAVENTQKSVAQTLETIGTTTQQAFENGRQLAETMQNTATNAVIDFQTNMATQRAERLAEQAQKAQDQLMMLQKMREGRE